MKTAIIVDSVGYLSAELLSHPDIYTVNLMVNFNDGTVMNDSGVEEEIVAFYDRLEQESQLPTTSQPNVGSYYNLLDKIVEKGYDTVFCIHLSAAISGTFQSAVMVTNEYRDKLTIHCIDSKGAAVGMQGLVNAAVTLINRGETADVIAEKLTWLADNIRIYFMVEDLSNLVKGGRLSATSAFLGSMLQIRPILYFDEQGKIVLFEKIRTNKKVYKRWFELVAQAKEQYVKGVNVAFAQADAFSEVQEIAQALKDEDSEIEITICPLGPVVGAHTGRKAKGLAIIPHIDNFPA
ncbi:DegV family protein [Aerococcaceae bacterium zg-ZJ1578]|uniref:DegV family protein n=1 Tax=Aerococcaceae TaxID=186827 RepID=UPI0013BA23FB|nr:MULTISPECIES: DegV family protein [unclassified Facklamia]MBK0347961.1 DegV family protein [Aerococcaceae bacterium zg-1578]MBR7927816.1 DegV family protein [Aerococcaceae bacterium zg-ZUI334]MBS4462619.1 DegV family protein [Aerococcaceae bacterium zg-B36]QQD65579.1 DegV family protein [Aerococcaceae bacterium zg-252]NEW64981.1 DegV family EDD domain-containing protein [Facklamia sp. 252]